MKKIRKIKTSSRKRKCKDAKKRLAEQTSLMMKHPKECCICNAEFVRTHETVKTWQVTIREARVRLTCPKCWGIIKEVLDEKRLNL